MKVRRRPEAAAAAAERETATASRTGLSRCTRRMLPASRWSILLLALGLLLLITPTRAAFINFQNCLSQAIQTGDPPPLRLQFIPYNVSASFDVTGANHDISFTIYGNVAGQASPGDLPPPSNHSHWTNPNETKGKITDLEMSDHKYSTLFAQLDVLNYQAFQSSGQRFCGSFSDDNVSCPLGPVFKPITPENSSLLPAVTYTHPMQSTYGFTTITAKINAVAGDPRESELLCLSMDVTPYVGDVAKNLLTYLPLMILVLVAMATASGAIFSPWGTWDVFRATSNYGREVRLLRMTTPGFGDCLNYLQFIFLTGSLSLSYPGFFQPAVSSVAWSVLMFNQSFVTHGPGRPSTVDGIYVANGTYGLDTMSQLVGMSDDQDLWAGMIIWLLTIIGSIVVLIQLAFGLRWLYRAVSKTSEEDLRAKNLPFSAGNTIRIVFNYFMVPITAFSLFQLVIAGGSPTPALVAMALLTLIILLAFTGWLVWVILDARPRSFLFDDLPMVLLYGPLYNTYSDSAAPFAVVTIILNFIRGVAIGAVQPSGIAQIVLLAICEVIFLLTLNAFRPFFSGTYMNLINTLFSVARLIIILLMVTFVPSLETSDASKGYIGYIILILHALVLFTGFFIRVLTTLFELTARAAGAGEDTSGIGGFARVLGLRQLSRRDARDAARSRASYASNATMLHHNGVEKSNGLPSGGRSRSVSAQSGLLLNNSAGNRQSVTLESVSGFGGPSQSGSNVQGSAAGAAAPSSSSFGPNGAGSAGAGTFAGLRSMEPADPYFRAPRPRRVTMELPEEARDSRSRNSWGSGDWARLRGRDAEAGELGEGPSVSGRGTPLPIASIRDRTDSVDERLPKPDYATREVDYYYGVRGPALSHMPTRRLKTGPADPTGPVSSATGWFMGFFGGKTKEKGKGFEVVRSSRMPPGMEMEEKTPAGAEEPLIDEPESSKRRLQLEDEGDAVGGGTRHLPGETGSTTRGDYVSVDGEGFQLPEIDAGESIHMPSRWASRASTKPSRGPSTRDAGREADRNIPPVPDFPPQLEFELETVPDVPRKSSRRVSVFTNSNQGSAEHVPWIDTTSTSAGGSRRGSGPSQQAGSARGSFPAQRIPFGNTLTTPATSRHVRTFSGGSEVSNVSAVSRTSEVSALTAENENQPPAWRDERPSSLGYVQQHRASDGIRHASGSVQGGQQSLTGSSAELVEPERRWNV